MEQSHGFSLTEVLISLCLMATTILAVVKQQWHLTQLFNQVSTQQQALIELDNYSEVFFVLNEQRTSLSRFKYAVSNNRNVIELSLAWQQPGNDKESGVSIKQRIA
jgi:Tfp pilus assembly protein PilV